MAAGSGIPQECAALCRGESPHSIHTPEAEIPPDYLTCGGSVLGDADFARNSFFDYLSNVDSTDSIAWLIREEKAPTMKLPVEVLPIVTLTGAQVLRHRGYGSASDCAYRAS
jgi:hypothetical protein